jgi:flagellar biosynthesis/type III secretory pathway chaperone
LTDSIETLRLLAELGERLAAVLEKEFSALVEKDLDLLESLQGQKVELLTQIEQAWQGFDAEASDDQNDLAAVRTLMADCKDKHIRNDLLLRRQMETVKNLLATLTNQSAERFGDVYNKLGRIKR